MRLLFVHQNFPGQYRHLAAHYAKQSGHQVVGLGEKLNVRRQARLPGVQLLGYEVPALETPDPFNASVLRAIHRGKRVAAAAVQLKRQGFSPDLIFAHIGWGEALFLKDIYPKARVVLYCEFFYRGRGADLGFDPEFPANAEKILRLRVMNAPLHARDSGNPEAPAERPHRDRRRRRGELLAAATRGRDLPSAHASRDRRQG